MPYPFPYSKDFYDNLPLYARLADEEKVLQHVAAAVQPPFNAIDRRLNQLPYNLNPAHPASSEFLDFLGQWVGLAVVGGRWLGCGLNPDWTDIEKRRVILRAWKYWQMKGTDWGIREAIYMWLGWEPTHDLNRHEIILPFGKRPTNSPPNWWGYDTTYDAHLLQVYPYRQHLGSGDYAPGVSYKSSSWIGLRQTEWKWDFTEVWGGNELEAVEPGIIENSTSHLGPNRPWQHFYLYNSEEWNKIFPDIYELTPQIWATQAIPSIFGWWVAQLPLLTLQENRQLPRTQTILEFDVDGVHYGDIYPYPSRPESQEVRQIEETIEFAIAGCEYTDLLCGTGGATITPPPVEVMVEREGIYPGCEYECDWYCGSVPSGSIVTVIPYEGNYSENLAFEEYQLQLWYFPPGENSVTQEVAPQPLDVALPPWFLGYWQGMQLITPPSYESEASPGTLWSALPHWINVVQDEVVTIPAVACTPGMQIDMVTGYHDWQKLVDAVPANQFLIYQKSHTQITAFVATPEVTPGFEWSDWWMMPVSASWVDPLSSEDDAYDQRWWTAKYQSPLLTAIHTRDRWELEEPVKIATFQSCYDQGWEWYSMGAPKRYETWSMPIVQRVTLCNVFNNWTMREIVYWHEYQILVPESELRYSLVDIYPMLKHLINGNEWRLFLECSSQIILIDPTTLMWVDPENPDRHQSFYSKEQKFTQLLIEFVIQPTTPDVIQSIRLQVDNTVIYQQVVDNLDIHPLGNFGFRFFLPTQPEVSPASPGGGLLDKVIVGSEELPPLDLSGVENTAEPTAFIREYILDNGIYQDGKTIYLIEVGLPSTDFDIGQTTATTRPYTEMSRLQTQIVDPERGVVKFSNWGPRIKDRSIRVLVYIRRQQNPEFLMSLNLRGGETIVTPSGMNQTKFLVDTELGHDRFAVGQIREIGETQKEVSRPRIVVMPTGIVELIFWGDTPVLDDTLQMFIYSSIKSL